MTALKYFVLLASVAASVLASPLAGTPQEAAAAAAAPLEDRQVQTQVQCGLVLCASGMSCCNPTCSMCTAPGMGCTMQDCGHRNPGGPVLPPPPGPTGTIGTLPVPPRPTRTAILPPIATPLPPSPYPGDGGAAVCGKSRCAKGYYCCNKSCGICAPKGGACIELFCRDGKLPGSN